MNKIKCPICGTEMDDDDFTDCQYCGWGYTGFEEAYEDDEKEDYNLISKNAAKKLVAEGKNIWGDPLPKK